MKQQDFFMFAIRLGVPSFAGGAIMAFICNEFVVGSILFILVGVSVFSYCKDLEKFYESATWSDAP